jgi:hypothetical protein
MSFQLPKLYDSAKQDTFMNIDDIDTLMEQEKQHNKNDIWSKLNKNMKTQKLHAFAEKYGKEHALSLKETKALKAFFLESLEKGKLQKTKDVSYDKEKREIQGIPALHYDIPNNHFTLKSLDTKRVSTLKSLSQKRTTTEEPINPVKYVHSP